jgi:hypothetical protein
MPPRLQLWWRSSSTRWTSPPCWPILALRRAPPSSSELTERLRYKLLPSTPETIDASELFARAARRVRCALAAGAGRASAAAPGPGPHRSPGASFWQHALLDAITYCAGQILSAGFAPSCACA